MNIYQNTMEQDVDSGFRTMCSTCLSTDRHLFLINNMPQVNEIFKLLMYDFAGDKFGDTLQELETLACWECLALMKKLVKFKWQVHNAQDHLRVLSLSRNQESLDHTYMSQSLSCLEMSTKTEYDKIFFDFSSNPEEQQFISIDSAQCVKNEHYDVAQVVRDNINLDITNHILEVPEIVFDNSVAGVMSHIVVGADTLVSSSDTVKTEMPHLTIEPLQTPKLETMVICDKNDKSEQKSCFVTEYMNDADMLAAREQAKKRVQYAGSAYKCELCIIGFYTQQQVEDHFVYAHSAKSGQVPCKVCYSYISESQMPQHIDEHHLRYSCKLCGHIEYSHRLMVLHAKTHMDKSLPKAVIKIGDSVSTSGKSRKKKDKESQSTVAKPGDLRKLLSKTTIEGYQCLECDMFFKNSRARKNHVDRCHREGLQCDHCKKRFVNRTTLTTHLRLHEGPLPRKECPICHKMVREIQLKYHIQRHQNKDRIECVNCNKIFSHYATYQAHLKYSRAHASDHVFKFPCPMCNKGYPSKEAMQDHFNYQHLGKTAHKCPICDKPIASRANVEKHMMRVHGEKKEKPRNHVCQACGKGFTDKKALNQHEVIHSGERPLACDICQQTFKQKASLYTHKKRVHKVFPAKRLVEYMDAKP